MSEICSLAPVDEPRCDRPAVVRIVDRAGESVPGCREHGVRALRGVEGARVYPLPGCDGEAIAVYQAARGGKLSG